MKAYADRKQYVKEHDVCVDGIVLAPQKKRNKFTTPNRKEKYVVTNVKGSMIIAQNAEGHIMTRDASKMKKIRIQQQNDAVNGQDIESDSDEVNKQQSTDVEQIRKEILHPIRRSSRVRRSTRDTRYKDYIV